MASCSDFQSGSQFGSRNERCNDSDESVAMEGNDSDGESPQSTTSDGANNLQHSESSQSQAATRPTTNRKNGPEPKSVDDILAMLRAASIPADVVETFKCQQVDGTAWDLLTNDDFKELCPLLGPRKKLQQLKNIKSHEVVSQSQPIVAAIRVSESGPTVTHMPCVPEFDVRDILQQSGAKGIGVINEYETMALSLSRQGRIKMVQILVNHMFTSCKQLGMKAPNDKAKREMAKAIIATFPRLKISGEGMNGHEHYYTPASHGAPACGFLQDRVENILRYQARIAKCADETDKPVKGLHQQSGGTAKRIRRSFGLSKNGATTATTSESDLTDKQVKKHRIWLLNNTEPKSEVLELMRKLWPARRKWIAGVTNPNLHEIFGKYPRYVDYPVTIENDFKELYQNVPKALTDVWPEKCLRVKTVLEQEKCQHELMKHLDGEDVSDVAVQNITMYLLPYCVFPSAAKGKKKVTTQEAMDGMLRVAKVGESMTEITSQRKTAYQSAGLTVQPYIIVVGTVAEPIKVYVSAGDKFIEMPTLIKAVEIVIYISFVCDIMYDFNANSTYTFLQRAICELKTKKDVVNSRILEVAQAINQM